MVNKASKAEKKIHYDSKLCQLLDEYSQILIAAADNVGSNQLQNNRRGLRGDCVVLMGTNTMMKRSIRMHAKKTGNDVFLNLIPLLQGNVGLIFTKGDLKEVSERVAKYKVRAPARVGLVAPIDVVVPPGYTGLYPSQTSFFQVSAWLDTLDVDAHPAALAALATAAAALAAASPAAAAA